jgi:RNA polymerase sigma factor (sigma-70 family)
VNIIDKNYKKWLNFSKIITSNKESEDLLHDVLINLLQKYPDLDELKWNDNFVFISLRNAFLTRVSKNKIDFDVEVIDLDSRDLIIDLESIKLDDIQFEKKMITIQNTVLSLNHFEQKLYELHFLKGFSQRRIAREVGVSHLTINSRVNKIKQKIKENYDK